MILGSGATILQLCANYLFLTVLFQIDLVVCPICMSTGLGLANHSKCRDRIALLSVCLCYICTSTGLGLANHSKCRDRIALLSVCLCYICTSTGLGLANHSKCRDRIALLSVCLCYICTSTGLGLANHSKCRDRIALLSVCLCYICTSTGLGLANIKFTNISNRWKYQRLWHADWQMCLINAIIPPVPLRLQWKNNKLPKIRGIIIVAIIFTC